MKKLLILAAVVCAAVLAQASSFKWTISSTAKVYDGKETPALFNGSAYLFAVADISQAAMLDAFVTGGTFDTSKAITSATLASGTQGGTEFSRGADGDTHQFYMAIVDGDNMYVSAAVNGSGVASKTTGVALKGTNSKNAPVEWTKGSTFASAGWYKVGSPTPTPEPTSSLLLVLGMAGLALRRRRA